MVNVWLYFSFKNTSLIFSDLNAFDEAISCTNNDYFLIGMLLIFVVSVNMPCSLLSFFFSKYRVMILVTCKIFLYFCTILRVPAFI